MKTLRRQRFGVRSAGKLSSSRCSRNLHHKQNRCRGCVGVESVYRENVEAGTIGLAAGSLAPETMIGRFAAFVVFGVGLGIWLAWLWMVVKAIAGTGGTMSFSEFLWQLRAVV